MKNEVLVDLPKRRERRFILIDPQTFLGLTSPYLERKKFSENEYVSTIYFNNDQHVVPFENSIKVRRYLRDLRDFRNSEAEPYFLDLKKGYGEDKEKVRLETTLEEATKVVNEEFSFLGEQLRPYVVTEYLRHHYVPRDHSNTRLTIDTNLRYFYLPNNKNEPIYLGKENYSRLEVKEGGSENGLIGQINEVIKNMNLAPIISKKFKAYNLLCSYHVKNSGKSFYKEIKDQEIESKLEVKSEEVFRKIKQFFTNRHDFRLPKHFPYTFESASINRYYKNINGPFKAMFLGDEVEIVRKGNGEIINDRFGLECILKRKETKGKIIKVDSDLISSSQLEGELYRMRKAFWIENLDDNRIYHISLDCCLGSPGKLYQIEVEHTGRYGIKKEVEIVKENEIIDNVARITKLLIENFPTLIPSKKTKTDWLKIKLT